MLDSQNRLILITYHLRRNQDQNDDELEEFCEQSKPRKYKKRTRARVIRSVFYDKEANPEKHYRELIMLFTPWRNEETDLLSNFTSYQEKYLHVKDTIEEQRCEYAVCSEDLDKIQDRLNNTDEDDLDRYDQIAPNTQDVESRDESEGIKDLHPDFNEAYDLSDDI